MCDPTLRARACYHPCADAFGIASNRFVNAQQVFRNRARAISGPPLGKDPRMKRIARTRWWAVVTIALFCLFLVALWQWQSLARVLIVAGAEKLAQVRLSFERSQIGTDRAVFENVRVTSFRNEPIAQIRRLEVAYDLRDLLPGGRRLYGLQFAEVDSPHVTIVRRADGTYNVPIPQLNPNAAHRGAPLEVHARVRDGSIEVINESPFALPSQRRLYAGDVQVNANISTANRSTYDVTLKYGERPDLLFPLVGRGVMDQTRGFIDQHWAAAQLPVAGVVNFVLNSQTLRLQTGMLENLDARCFGVRNTTGSLQPHLAASAAFRGGRIAIAGLAKPVTGVQGPVDVYDDGLLTSGLRANLAGVPATVVGGVYALQNPILRVAVRGSGDLAQLRTAFTQAQRLPARGPVSFGLLVEGAAKAPLTWIALRSPETTYAATALQNIEGLLAFDGREADVIEFRGKYGRVALRARGRVSLKKEPNAIEMLVQANSPPGGTPYLNVLMPHIPLNAVALATANDPKLIAVRGALWGSGGAQSLDAIFNVDERGNGTIGPLYARSGRGVLYARIALERTGGSSVGLVEARDFPLPAAKSALDATLIGSQTRAGIAVAGTARLAGAWGAATAHGSGAMRDGALHGGIFGDLGSQGSFGATIGGTPRSPQIAGTVVIAGSRYRNFGVNGNAGLAYENGTLDVHDAAVAIGPLFLGIEGTIDGVLPHGAFAPQYDLAAQVHSSDVGALVATIAPRNAPPVQGSIDADLRVRGTGSAPSFAGRVSAPEGSINGLSFRNFEADVSGDVDALSVKEGRVVVGSSPITLSASAKRTGAADVSLQAPQLDLSDLNDFFDSGDTFAGTGSLALRASVIGTRVLSTSGDANFSNARFRRLDLGEVAARWNSTGNSIATALSFGGPAGEVALDGTIALSSRSVDLNASARRLDLTTWLPMLGYIVPVTGRLDARTTLAGTYPDLAMRAHAEVFGGTAGRMPIERFELSASALNGRATIESAVLDVPSMSTVVSGGFGLRGSDPLALVVTSTSANVGDFLTRATGKDFGISGSFSSTLHVEGTRGAPRLRDTIALQTVRYRNLTIPRVAAELDADKQTLAVRNGEVDLERGKALLSAAMPIAFTAGRVAPGSGPISGAVTADDVELLNFTDLLPKGTQVSGRIDGRVNAAGTIAAPNLEGTLTLADGTFSGPMEKSPITGIAATLALSGTRAQLQSHAFVGTGRVTASGRASLADLRRPAAAMFSFEAAATNVRLDLPAYFQGDLNGAVALMRNAGAVPAVSGDLTISKARLPLSAFLTLNKGGGTGPRMPNIAFQGLDLTVGPDVRVQSANVDIGTTGAVRLGGTLDAPTLSGGFRSTGGSLSFYRAFNIERGEVTFEPSGGLIPNVDAVATTFVPDPATAIRLNVTGPVTNMNLTLASDPPYSKQQILGLLVGAQQFGAVQGVQSTGTGAFSASSAAQTLAMGQLNTAFTRTVLEPLSTSVGGALGFSEVQITADVQTGLGVNAVKAFGKFVNAIYAQSFGYPRTQSVALEAHPNPSTSLRLTAFTTDGPTLFAVQQPQPVAASVLNVNPVTSFTPISASNGASFSYVRRFWRFW